MNLTLEAYQFLQQTYQLAAMSATEDERQLLLPNDLRALAQAADEFHLNETQLQENFWALFAFNSGEDFDTYFQIEPIAATQPRYWQRKNGGYLHRGRFSYDELQLTPDFDEANKLSANELIRKGVSLYSYTPMDA